VAGEVKFFRGAEAFPAGLSVPHMGWNDVRVVKSVLFKNLPPVFPAYFVHSYYVKPAEDQVTAGVTDYGLDFCSALASKNIFGVQFHPEKSGEAGLQILKNFLETANSGCSC
jgi:glutamine amidotransferase